MGHIEGSFGGEGAPSTVNNFVFVGDEATLSLDGGNLPTISFPTTLFQAPHGDIILGDLFIYGETIADITQPISPEVNNPIFPYYLSNQWDFIYNTSQATGNRTPTTPIPSVRFKALYSPFDITAPVASVGDIVISDTMLGFRNFSGVTTDYFSVDNSSGTVQRASSVGILYGYSVRFQIDTNFSSFEELTIGCSMISNSPIFASNIDVPE